MVVVVAAARLRCRAAIAETVSQALRPVVKFNATKSSGARLYVESRFAGSGRSPLHRPGRRSQRWWRQRADGWCRHDQAEIVEHLAPRCGCGRSLAVGTEHAAIPAIAGRAVVHAAGTRVTTAAEPPSDAGDRAGGHGVAKWRLGRSSTRRPGQKRKPEPRERQEEQHAPGRHDGEINGRRLRFPRARHLFRAARRRPTRSGQSAGPIIFSGRTRASNSASSRRARARAAAFNVEPSACAFLATLAALS